MSQRISNLHRKTTARTIMLLLALSVPSARSLHATATVDLQSVEQHSSVKLTTVGRSSGQPRTVTIWFVCDDGRLYLQAGKDGHTDWYRNLLKHPQVTLDFGGHVLRGQARAIEDPREVKRIHDLFRQKYLMARVMSWFGGEFGMGKVVMVESLEDAGPDRQ